MRRSTRAMLAAAASLAILLTGCSSSGSGSKASDGKKEVGVFTWWSAGSEKLGLEGLEKVLASQHPDVKFVNLAVSGGAGSNAKQKLQADLAAKQPPDSFQAHAGAELMDYIEAKQIEPVNDLYDKFGLNNAFPKSLIERLTVNGKIYSIPSNIHRANVVWANPEVIKAAGLDPAKPATSIEAWIADMEKIKATGKIPITIGAPWTQTQLFETILIGDIGADEYNGLFNGKTKWDSDKVKTAVKHFGQIVKLAQLNSTADWEPMIKPIIDGQAAYNVMGDWALAAFNSASKVYKKDYIAFPVPGNEKIFDFLADSFTLPVGAPHPEGAKAWLDTISSKDGQLKFNEIKGSIPARTDVTFPSDDKFAYQRDAMEAFKNDTIVSSIAHGAALPVSASTKINAAVEKFTSGASNEEAFVKDLVAATASLAH